MVSYIRYVIQSVVFIHSFFIHSFFIQSLCREHGSRAGHQSATRFVDSCVYFISAGDCVMRLTLIPTDLIMAAIRSAVSLAAAEA